MDIGDIKGGVWCHGASHELSWQVQSSTKYHTCSDEIK